MSRLGSTSAPIRSRSLRLWVASGFVAVLLPLTVTIAAQQSPVVTQPQVDRNVNMVSGRDWPGGDPFLQRQNEPSVAISTRNAQHLLAGANDYRTVDLPSVLNSAETGDAWLGVFKSLDGGNTWKSTLVPGYPQDTSREGLGSPIKGFQAGSDPVVRGGVGGLFYYLGMAFNRSDGNAVLFVSRYVDSNNKEAGDPISFVDTNLIHKGNKKHFLDKPWLAVDIPRSNTKACSIRVPNADGSVSTQSFPGGNVYVAYTDADPDDTSVTRLMFSRSTNCGVTWEGAQRVSDPHTTNSGATIAIDPNTGTVYVAWRQVWARDAARPVPNAVMIAKSLNGGTAFSKPVTVQQFQPFDFKSLPNAESPTWRHFRTTAYPTLAVDANRDASRPGRVYLAWSELGRGPLNESRIMLAVSETEAASFFEPRVVDDAGGRFAYQTMPSMTFASGKLMLIYYDFRFDMKPIPTDQTADKKDDYATLWHTVDVRAAQAEPASTPLFITAPVSRYLFVRDKSGKIKQAQANAVNYPLFAGGNLPFLGDYIDVAAPSMVQNSKGQWKFNTDASSSPVFQSVWTDNRDVLPPPKPQHWEKYTPAGSPGATQSVFDPSKIVDPCVAGTAGMRNQNIYTARITQGLVVSSPGNSKPLGRIQRAFVVYVENTTRVTRYYRLTIEPTDGVKASFLQFEPRPSLDVAVGTRSSIARPVFVSSTNPHAAVKVDVFEITAAGTPVVQGLQSSVTLNPDILNPDILNPDILNPDILNPDILNAEVTAPNITSATLADFNGDGHADIINPDILNPDILNPDILNPDILNPDILNPDILNPDILNPDILNPDILNPDILNPDILNTDPDVLATDPAKLQINDIFWNIKNKGNTTAAYTFKLMFPKRPKGFKFQLLIYRVSSTPTVKGCAPADQTHEQLVANIINPDILNPDILNPDILNSDLTDASLYLAPGDTARIQLRVFDLDKFDSNVITIKSTSSARAARMLSTEARELDLGTFADVQIGGQPLTAAVVSEAVDTTAAQAGITQPSAATTRLTITTTVLPAGQVNIPFLYQLLASGGTTPLLWSLAPGSTLPANLSLSPGGLLSGTPANAGSVPFTVFVQDSIGQLATQELVISVSPPAGVAALAFVTEPVPCSDTVNPEPNCTRQGTAITPPGSVQARNAAGALVPGLAVTIKLGVNTGGGTLSGTTTATTDSSGVAGFGSLSISQPGSYTFIATASGFPPVATTTFNVIQSIRITTASLPDGVTGKPYDITVAASGGIGARTWSVIGGSLPSGLVLDSSSGRIAGTPDFALNSTFTLKATDSGSPQQYDTRSFSIHVADPLLISTAALPDGVKGSVYDTTIGATGGTGTKIWTITSGTLPFSPGLDPGTGRIFGTSDTSGTFNFTLKVTDSASPQQTDTHAFSIRIADPLIMSNSTLPDGVKGSVYDTTVGLTGGTGTKTWTITSGSLPFSSSLDPGTGRIFGSPDTSGTFNFMLKVTDSASPQQSDTHTFSIRIADPLRIATSTLPDGVKGTSYDVTLGVIGGTGTRTWTIESGSSLPSNLSLDLSTGRISGTPDTAGIFTFTVRVTDSASPPQTNTHSFSITVLDATFTEFSTPSANSTPLGIIAGPDGNLWFAEYGADRIGKITPSGLITEYAVLTAGSHPYSITVGPDGNLWFTEPDANRIGRITPSGTVSEFPVPAGSQPYGIAAGEDGNLWFTAQFGNYVGRMNTAGNLTGQFTVPTSSSIPLGITAGPDGNLWFVEQIANKIGRITTSGSFSEYLIPSGGSQSVSITTGLDGNLWFEEYGPNKIGRITPSGAIAEFAIPTPSSSPSTMTRGPDGNVWFTELGYSVIPYVGKIARVTSAGVISEFAVPTLNSWPTGIVMGADGNLWFTEQKANKIGRVAISPASPVIDQQFIPTGGFSASPPDPGGFEATVQPLSLDPSYAQTFTVGVTGQLTGADLGLDAAAAGRSLNNVIVEVRTASAGLPASTVLGRGTISGSAIPFANPTLSFVHVDFPPGIFIRAGMKLALLFYGDGDSIHNPNIAGQTSATRLYSGGEAFVFVSGAWKPAVQIFHSGQTGSDNFVFRTFAEPGPGPLTIDTLTLPDAVTGKLYDATVLSTGGTGPNTWTVTIGSLPSHLGLDAGSGRITGTPDVGGTSAFTLKVADSGSLLQTDTRSFSIRVADPLVISTTTLPDGVKGKPYDFTVASTGGIGNRTWTVEPAGSLPSGLTLESGTGRIIGTPNTAGNFPFTVKVRDSSSPQQADTHALSIRVGDPLVIVTTTLPDADASANYNQPLVASGGIGTVTWTLDTASTLPAGLTLSEAGVISGQPTVTGDFSFTIRATDSSVPAQTITRTFALHISSAPTWTPLFASGGPPAPRANFINAGFDPSTDRLIVFDGQNNGGNLNDVWVLSNADAVGVMPHWVSLTPTPDPVYGSPDGRNAASVVYDPASNRLIVFDGCLGNCLPIANDLWVLTNANDSGGTPAWIRLLPAGSAPGARESMASVYDPGSNTMIVFGGQNGCCGNQITYNDVWTLQHANGLGGTPTWVQLFPSGGPPEGQTALSAVYDAANNKMIVFGGLPYQAQTYRNGVWVLSHANGQGGTPVWTNIVAEGAPGSPSPRAGHSAVYDSAANRMIVFGGSATALYNDTWVLTNANGTGGIPVWSQLSTTGGPPAPRTAFGSVFNQASGRMTIFAGSSSSGHLNDVWVLSLSGSDGSQPETINPGDVLQIRFKTLQSPDCAGPVSQCDTLIFNIDFSSTAAAPTTATLYNSATLLGTFQTTNECLLAGTCAALVPSFVAAGSVYDLGSPVIDFTSILNGTIDGVLNLTVTAATKVNLDPNKSAIIVARAPQHGTTATGYFVRPTSLTVIRSDDFESASIGSYWSNSGPGTATLSTATAHTGNQSLKLSASTTFPWFTGIAHDFDSAQSRSISVWVRGDQLCCGSGAALEVYNGQGTQWGLIQQSGNGNCPSCFVVRAFDQSLGPEVDTPFTASASSWHLFEIAAGPAGATFKFDGAVVFTFPTFTSIKSFDFTVWGGPGGTAYFDDLQTLTPNMILDPGTTVGGRVVDGNGNPVAGATVTTNGGRSALSVADGSFSISSVPTILGNIVVNVTFTSSNGTRLAGFSGPALPVPSGVTTVGSSCVVPTSGLVSWWPADGNTNDSIGGMNGAIHGTVTFAQTPAIGAGSFQFDGTSFIQVPTSARLEPPLITVSAWVKASSVGPFKYILSKQFGTSDGSYALYSGSSSGLYFYVSNGPGTTILSPNAGSAVWNGALHHVAGTFDGGTVRLFVDGAEVGTGTPNARLSYSTPPNDLFIGTFAGSTNGTFNWPGIIDEVQIFDRALTGTEIRNIFLSGTGQCRYPDAITITPIP